MLHLIFHCLTVEVLFCSLKKGLTPKICIVVFCHDQQHSFDPLMCFVMINSIHLTLSCVWILHHTHSHDLRFLHVSAPYVKVYLLEGKHCVEKQKTTTARRTLDPLYQQQLVFSESYRGRILQVSRWMMLCTSFIYQVCLGFFLWVISK